jgi:hypothetical protein
MEKISTLKMELFAEGIGLKTLNNKIDLHVLRKSLRDMKNEFLKNTPLANYEEIEKFKAFEERNVTIAIQKVQLTDDELLYVELSINPYLVFTQTTMPENGRIEEPARQYDIVLQPKFLALGRPVFIPIYLMGDKINLLKMREFERVISGTKLLHKALERETSLNPEVIKTRIVSMLRRFLLYQFLIPIYD